MTPGMRQLTDLRMYELSYSIRSKPKWWTKYESRRIRAKWMREALEVTFEDGRKLSRREVEWVLDELPEYEMLRDPETGVQVSS